MAVTFDSFAEAKNACPEGMRVCGTYRGKDPVYFLAPAEADDEAIRDVAFEVRHGRPIGVERDLGALAEALGVKA